MINEITGRRTAKKGIIKANDKRDRINKWYTYLQERLGKERTVEGDLDAISPILRGMELEDGPITEAEYTAVKKSIKEGRACGPDGILPDVFKHCDLYHPCFCEQTA